MIHESGARTRTERIRVNTIHSLISWTKRRKKNAREKGEKNENSADVLRGPKCTWNIFEQGDVEYLGKPWSAFFNDVAPFASNNVVYSKLSSVAINHLSCSRDAA